MKILAATQVLNAAVETGGSMRHGLLTFALLREGLEGYKADFRASDKTINLQEWLEYGEFRVPVPYNDLASGRLKGRAGADLFGGALTTPQGWAQQPSLFDFTRKKSEMIVAQVP